MRGIGLTVNLNDHSSRLLLDTGAGGIFVSHKVAEKAGLTRISAGHYAGMRDRGLQSGYTAVADDIRIGELEFQDCVVRVSDKSSVGDEDGLIGADVFGAYLVDIDLPGMQLMLSPLPKRPEDSVAPTSLNSEGEEQENAEHKEENSVGQKGVAKDTTEAPAVAAGTPSSTGQTAITPPSSTGQTAPTTQAAHDQKPTARPVKSARRLPRDRYVAPEMANWTKVFRFGHTMLVPTFVNHANSAMLFGLDTGAFANLLSVRAGRQVSKVSSEDRIRVRGLNGEVNKVYSAKATLCFGHLQQPAMDVLTIDLSAESRRIATEVSGFLGFAMLRMLDVKLDYRDGLVDFGYDPKRLPAFVR